MVVLIIVFSSFTLHFAPLLLGDWLRDAHLHCVNYIGASCKHWKCITVVSMHCNWRIRTVGHEDCSWLVKWKVLFLLLVTTVVFWSYFAACLLHKCIFFIVFCLEIWSQPHYHTEGALSCCHEYFFPDHVNHEWGIGMSESQWRW